MGEQQRKVIFLKVHIDFLSCCHLVKNLMNLPRILRDSVKQTMQQPSYANCIYPKPIS
jgi:hypothetical protein